MGKIVAIVGSSKFKEQHLVAAAQETLRGNIALNYGFYHHVDRYPITDEKKFQIDALNKAKIRMADEVFVVNLKGYIGQTTKELIDYALTCDPPKKVTFLESTGGTPT